MIESWIYTCLLEGNLEPEPVDDLQATDEREAGEEAHHAAHPGDLVRKGHPGTLRDLNSFLVFIYVPGFFLGFRLYVLCSHLCYDEVIGFIVECHLEYIPLPLGQSALNYNYL